MAWPYGVTVVQLIALLNSALAIYLSKLFGGASRKFRGRAFAGTLSLLSLAFVIFALRELIAFASFLPQQMLDWELLGRAIDVIFILILIYAFGRLKANIDAYLHLLKRK